MDKIKKMLRRINMNIVYTVLVSLVVVAPIFTVIFRALDIEGDTEISLIITKVVGYIGLLVAIVKIISMLISNKFKWLKNKRLIPLALFFCFLVWALIVCFFARDMYKAFNGYTYRNEGFYTYLAYGGICFLACMITPKSKKIICNIMIFTAIVLVVLGAIDFEKKEDIFPHWDTLSSVFTNPNHYGYFLVIPTICSFGLLMTEKWYYKIAYAVAFVALLSTLINTGTVGSYSAVFICVIGIIIYHIVSKKKFVYGFIGLCVLVICTLFLQSAFLKETIVIDAKKSIEEFWALFNEDADIVKNLYNSEIKHFKELKGPERRVAEYGSGRFLLWINSIKLIKQSPIVGYGMENVTEKMLGGGSGSPHNLIFSVTLFTGIPGALFYFLGVGLVLIKARTRLKKLEPVEVITYFSCVGYLISSMFGISKYYTSPYFFVFFGMLYGIWLLPVMKKNK